MKKLPEKAPGCPEGRHYIAELPPELEHIEPNVGWDNYANRGASFRASLAAVTIDGPFAQFGVYQGQTARQFIEPALKNRELWLFDSFQGLPEDWDKGASVEAKGKYACQLPRFGKNVHVVAGWYEDTLPKFREGEPFAFMDIDCDLYSSTATVLTELNERIVPGTVIRFDELISYPTWREHEWRAFVEWCAKFNRKVKWFDRGRIYWASCVVTQ